MQEAAVAIAFFEDSLFESDSAHAMGVAFQSACRTLGLSGRVDPLTKTLARKIVALAQHGENDPIRLCHGALASMACQVRPVRVAGTARRNRFRPQLARRASYV
jgi:hypothetical protein